MDSAGEGELHILIYMDIFRPCLVGLLVLAFGPKSQKPNQRGCFWRVLFQKQLLFRSSFLKAGLTLLLAFGFLLFEIGGIKSSSIVVSREIKIKCIFYTCLTKQLSAFLQLTAHSSFSTAHSPLQLFPTATAQPNGTSVRLEIVLTSMQDRCMVCAKRTIGSEISWYS